jgi:26S proteasome regulatory subunit N7
MCEWVVPTACFLLFPDVRSVTLEGVAAAFGVSGGFMDAELARFIASRRLNAKINKVTGVVESTRPNTKNARYEDVLRRGDALMSRVQRLARALDV